jgi:hypothetical protein
MTSISNTLRFGAAPGAAPKKTRSSKINNKENSVLSSYPLTAKAHPVEGPFLGSKIDFTVYQKAQQELTQAASSRDTPTTYHPPQAYQNLVKGAQVRFPTSKSKICAKKQQKKERIHQKPYAAPSVRGLFADKKYKKGQFVVPYDGEILTDEEFRMKYPPRDQGKRLMLKAHEFSKDESAGAGPNSVVIKDSVMHYGGMKGEIVKQLEGSRHFVIVLDGLHDAQHTLPIPKTNLYIDAETTVSGQTYLIGAGALINSADPEYEEGLKPNVEYRVCPKSEQAIIVATKDIAKGEEFLASYLPENIVIEKSKKKMWEKVGINPTPMEIDNS